MSSASKSAWHLVRVPCVHFLTSLLIFVCSSTLPSKELLLKITNLNEGRRPPGHWHMLHTRNNKSFFIVFYGFPCFQHSCEEWAGQAVLLFYRSWDSEGQMAWLMLIGSHVWRWTPGKAIVHLSTASPTHTRKPASHMEQRNKHAPLEPPRSRSPTNASCPHNRMVWASPEWRTPYCCAQFRESFPPTPHYKGLWNLI